MLKIKNVSARNFMSIGAQTQAVNFDNNQLTLVLGHNLDLGVMVAEMVQVKPLSLTHSAMACMVRLSLTSSVTT